MINCSAHVSICIIYGIWLHALLIFDCPFIECTKIELCVFTAGYFHSNPNNNLSNIDLNSVRLCFQVFLPDANKKFTHIIQPVVSQPIVDKSMCFIFNNSSPSTQHFVFSLEPNYFSRNFYSIYRLLNW